MLKGEYPARSAHLVGKHDADIANIGAHIVNYHSRLDQVDNSCL